MNVQDYHTVAKPTWCPGCGNFAIQTAFKMAMVELGIDPHNVAAFSGIGCSSKLPHWVNTYGFHTIHGRPLPVATGAKLSNRKLNVVVFAGDGDSYGIGTCHWIHAMRRNLNMTMIVHNNLIYGLTKAQASPTSELGFVTKTTPKGVVEEPINPIAVSIAAGATFVGRGYSGDLKKTKELIKKAIQHKGFAIVDILQPCVTFNKWDTFDFYNSRVYDLQKEGHDTADVIKALDRAHEWGKKIPEGVFYEVEKPVYEDHLHQLDAELIEEDIENIDIGPIMETFY
jgi:2-oxoglutarate/2-oxoacid ferredoxin oxidoreductase subunit beta